MAREQTGPSIVIAGSLCPDDKSDLLSLVEILTGLRSCRCNERRYNE